MSVFEPIEINVNSQELKRGFAEFKYYESDILPKITAYEGYFNNGQFYVSGKTVRIPEKKRVVITILDDAKIVNSDKITAWNDFKRMAEDTAHENDLLTDDAFNRSGGGRELIDFTGGTDSL
ncbi:MAG: hypothetical protein FWH10_04170 [Oscillospiraceae bacterium]|nr:hypothetical protein [Oscillospiraceae bacterium]